MFLSTRRVTHAFVFQVETLQEEVANIRRDIQKFHSEDTELDNTRKSIMKDLEVCSVSDFEDCFL